MSLVFISFVRIIFTSVLFLKVPLDYMMSAFLNNVFINSSNLYRES